MEAESSLRFLQQGLSSGAGHAHSAGGVARQVIPGAGGMIPSMGTLMAGFGMAPTAGVFLPGRPPVSPAALYNSAARSVWNAGPAVVIAPGQQQRQEGGGGNNNHHANNGERAPPPQHLKGPWSAEEDDILREKVMEHGDRRWAVVARFLPGRIGKQCRERWTNHLRPDIRKSLWSEEDDLALIQAHKAYGNRWSVIAKCLPGRSENMVKNHWNATRRSLRAKRRVKRVNKKNAPAPPPEQLSVLEQYIRALYPVPVDLDVATPPPASPPPSYNLGYGDEGVVTPPPAAAAGTMGMMYFNSSGGSSSSTTPPASDVTGVAMSNMNVPPSMMLDLNSYYGEQVSPLSLSAASSQVMMDHDHLHQQQQQQDSSSYANMMMMLMNYQQTYLDNFMWQQQPTVVQNIAGGANNDNANTTAGDHPLYYGADDGPSGGPDNNGGGSVVDEDDGDVVEMASREFLTPSQEEATLDLTKFM